MRKSLSIIIGLVFYATLFSCGGTEIDKNPTPIIWGGISFFPTTIERSKNKTVWNNVKIAGYGANGVIDRVIITPGETVVENIQIGGYSAKKQIWKGATGEYRQALEYFASGNYRKIYERRNAQALPRFNIASYEGQEEKLIDSDVKILVGSEHIQNLSFNGTGKWEIRDIAFQEKKEPEVKIASASVDRIVIPENVESHPENIVLNNLALGNIQVAELGAKVDKIYLDYNNYELKVGVDKAVIPGKALAEFHIPNMPDMVEASLNGVGEYKNDFFNAEGNLNLAGLLDASADLVANIRARYPERLNFSIKDLGIISSLPADVKTKLAMLALMIPNGQTAVMGFLAKPDQTLTGNVTFQGPIPQFSFSLK